MQDPTLHSAPVVSSPGQGSLRDRTARVLLALIDDLTVESDETTLLQAALERTVDTLGLEGGLTFMLDPHGAELRLAAGTPEPALRQAAHDLAARVLAHGHALRGQRPGGGFVVATPLAARGALLGVLALHDPGHDGAVPDHELLAALGKQIGAGLDNVRHYVALRSVSERLESAGRLTAALVSGLEPRLALPAFASELRRLVTFDRLACVFVNEAHQDHEVISHPDTAGWGLGETMPLAGSGPGHAARSGRPVVCPDLLTPHGRAGTFAEDPRLAAEGLRSYLLLPLRARGHVVSVLALGSHTAGAYGEAQARYLEPFADTLGLAFENVHLMQKTRELSLTDDVTPLYNYRFVHQILDRELALCERYGAVLSLIFLDLDNFKPINDRHGHLCGTRALREVGFLLRDGVREGNYAARYGGDEFVIILPQTGHDEAHAVAEAVRGRILQHTFLGQEGLAARLGASVGVATFPAEARSKEGLLRLADERMYADKERRRAQR